MNNNDQYVERFSHSTPNSGNFGWYNKWNGPFRFALTRDQWPRHFGRSNRIDKIVVPSTALLYPAYKNNNQTRGGLGRVCAIVMYRSIRHVEFP